MKREPGGGIGYFTVIGIVFIVLKILAVHPVSNWSWLWVLCPFWGPVALGIIIICILVAFLLK